MTFLIRKLERKACFLCSQERVTINKEWNPYRWDEAFPPRPILLLINKKQILEIPDIKTFLYSKQTAAF